MERPNNKVSAGALAGAFSVIAVTLWPGDPSAELAVAFTTIFTFALSYFVRD